MKAFTKIMLAAAVLSGAVSVNIHRNRDRLVFEAEAENPEEILRTAGKLISAAGSMVNQAAGTVVSALPAESPAAWTADACASSFDAQAPCEPPAGQRFYRIRNASGEAASQLGANLNLDTAVEMCPAGYCIFDMDGRMVYP